MSNVTQILLAEDRAQRLQQVRQCFPAAGGCDLSSDWPGGRQQALQRLSALDAAAYARTRNHLTGAVSRLSPYFRHGCLSTREAIDQLVAQQAGTAGKLISELAYRDYFRQVWYHFGVDILQALESPKVVLGDAPLPAFVQQGFTGLVCMDEVVRQLQQEGYVHNHARMWFAAYVVHWLKVDWRQAADWFALHLLDGDLASNHLSWQWVASTLSQKPYYFNRENIQTFGGGGWCRQCSANCPFDASYDALHAQLFMPVASDEAALPSMPVRPVPGPEPVAPQVVWVHEEMLSPEHPLLKTALPAIFVFDPVLYAGWPRKRLQFMADCLAEMPTVQVWQGRVTDVLRHLGMRTACTQQTPRADLKQVVEGYTVAWHEETMLTDMPFSAHTLMRFSRYWKQIAPALDLQGRNGTREA